jgi:hypothetical protein
MIQILNSIGKCLIIRLTIRTNKEKLIRFLLQFQNNEVIKSYIFNQIQCSKWFQLGVLFKR